MSTPINNFQDILDAMERNPELAAAMRRHILTEELLHTPAMLFNFIERQTAFNEEMTSFVKEQRTFNEEQRTFNQEVTSFVKEQRTFNQEQKTFNQEVTSFINEQRTFNQEMNKTRGDVSNLKGDDYESHIATYIHRALRRDLNINATVFSTQKNMQPLIELLDEAEAQGKITKEETDKLNYVDIVLTVNGKNEYIVGEISITIQQNDVQRTSEWADILAKATGAAVTPMAIGTAEETGLTKDEVQVLLVPQRQAT